MLTLNKQKVIEIYEQGMKVKDIADLLNTSPQAIHWHLKNRQKREPRKYQPSTKLKEVKRYSDYLAIDVKKHPKSY